MKPEFQQKGIKRKRHEQFRETSQKDVGTKVVGKLHHDLKEVRKAAKKAKAFETQKLVKKLKSLRLREGSEQDINDCESQLEELKGLSHDAVANTALKSRLSKDKVLSENESMQTAMDRELSSNLLSPATGGTIAARVQSRLLSSKILAAEVNTTVEDLRAVVRPVEDSQDADISVEDEIMERPKKLKKVEGKALTVRSGDEDVEMDLETTEGKVLEQTPDDDVDAAGWESGTIGDDEREPGDDWESTSLGDNGSDGYMDEDTPEEDEEAVSKPSTSKAGPTRSKVQDGQSTFVSSLSTGFVRGDSDSDWSESEAKVADFTQKKNRRGQRARRAIWEKKYGRNANHKKKEAAETAERGRKRWPNTNSERRDTHGNSSQFTFARQGKTIKQDAPVQQDVDRPQRNESSASGKALHPSWEAKKKLKEKQSINVQPPPGRKIKFS
ncbi:Bud-site selection protein [Dendrothele bispora CBS 962.96]|uniref:Bud-site selection protein n=1 Tax=Dendrothele bispora (strain CBS 962.96) TaxID=1314807 RepID=A0A4S8MQW0_DENBC|nr:Bud-site selection protein [Dendrothele bispora CBS 962.96]